MSTIPGQQFVSLPQIMQAYGISRPFIYQLRREGKISFHYVNSKPFVRIEDFERLMRPEAAA